MGNFLVINNANFSNKAIDKVLLVSTTELVKKAFLLSNYGNAEGQNIGIFPHDSRGLLVIKKTDTDIPLNFDTDYSYIPIYGDIKEVSVKITNANYNIGLCLFSDKNRRVYDSGWQSAGQVLRVNVKDYLSETQGKLYICVIFSSSTGQEFTNETLESLGFEITLE